MTDSCSQVPEFGPAELLRLFRVKWKGILAVTILCAALALLITACFLTPQYEADVNMIVNTNQGTILTNDNITSAKNLVDTYAVIIKSNIVLEPVIQALGLNLDYQTLCEKIEVAPINDTQIMRISARDADPDLAAQIVRTISEIAPPVISTAVEFGTCKPVSHVKVSSGPVSPDVGKATLIAAFLGFVLSSGFVLAQALMADIIGNEKDAQNRQTLPIPDAIPEE